MGLDCGVQKGCAMTTLTLPRASTYWRDRFLGIAASLRTELHEEAAYFCFERRNMAIDRLTMTVPRAEQPRIQEYTASNYLTNSEPEWARGLFDGMFD